MLSLLAEANKDTSRLLLGLPMISCCAYNTKYVRVRVSAEKRRGRDGRGQKKLTNYWSRKGAVSGQGGQNIIMVAVCPLVPEQWTTDVTTPRKVG